MTYHHLADFLSELEDDGELVRIAATVDSEFELAAIVNQVYRSGANGGPAVLFDSVKDYSMPVVANLLGSEARMCRALGSKTLDEVSQRITAIVKPDLPNSWLESLKMIPQISNLANLPPKTVESGVCQQVVKMGRDVDLSELPIPHIWPQDKGPSITAGQIHTQYPQTHATDSADLDSTSTEATSGVRNISQSVLQIRSTDSCWIHWNIHDEPWHILERYRRQNQQMPVAVVLGGDPILTYAASAPLPQKTDALLLSGFLRNDNVELVKCRSNELWIPSTAEIVLEGMIDADASFESAAGIASTTGFCGPDEDLPVLHVHAITHRANPVFPTMIPARPCCEEDWLQTTTARLFLPLVKLFIPEVVDFHLPRCGAFRNFLFVSFNKQYPQQAHKVINALWSLPQLMSTKIVVAVDGDVDVRNEDQVWFQMGANVYPGRDTFVSHGPADMSDHSAPVRGMGAKLGIDATRKLNTEGHLRDWPEELKMQHNIEQLVQDRWTEYGIEL